MTDKLRAESGAPVADNQHSQTAGPGGPVLLQDQHLHREAGPLQPRAHPRARRARRGSGAYGHFEVTEDVTPYTKATLPRRGRQDRPRCSRASRPWPAGAARPTRCATRAASRSSSTPRTATTTSWATTRRSSSSATRSSSPTSSTRRSATRTPTCRSRTTSGTSSPSRPEATHQFTWLFGDRGIPASYRHMDGFGSHTFQWVNAAGEQFWVKYHFKTDQGIKCLTARGGGAARRREPGLAPDGPARGDRPRRVPRPGR